MSKVPVSTLERFLLGEQRASQVDGLPVEAKTAV